MFFLFLIYIGFEKKKKNLKKKNYKKKKRVEEGFSNSRNGGYFIYLRRSGVSLYVGEPQICRCTHAYM